VKRSEVPSSAQVKFLCRTVAQETSVCRVDAMTANDPTRRTENVCIKRGWLERSDDKEFAIYGRVMFAHYRLTKDGEDAISSYFLRRRYNRVVP
jgi:hypothetical protein